MIECHRNHDHQATCVFSQTHQVPADSERRLVGRDSRSARGPAASSHPGGEILAIWSFVVFCFAALLFCLYVISVKCHTASPF
jgi:hypothetical protein